jgi:hypothetical protein
VKNLQLPVIRKAAEQDALAEATRAAREKAASDALEKLHQAVREYAIRVARYYGFEHTPHVSIALYNRIGRKGNGNGAIEDGEAAAQKQRLLGMCAGSTIADAIRFLRNQLPQSEFDWEPDTKTTWPRLLKLTAVQNFLARTNGSSGK